MFPYDPNLAPDPDVWLALDEPSKTAAVAAHFGYHTCPDDAAFWNMRFYCEAENLLASGDGRVAGALARLTAEGLSRKDAVFAIGIAWSGVLRDAKQSEDGVLEINDAFFEATMKALDAKTIKAQNLAGRKSVLPFRQ